MILAHRRLALSASFHNQLIVDLANAINLHNGEVELSADFIAVRPKNATKGDGTLLLENPNLGHSPILSMVDGGDEDLAHTAGAPGCCATV